jgi:hypothetical protein
MRHDFYYYSTMGIATLNFRAAKDSHVSAFPGTVQHRTAQNCTVVGHDAAAIVPYMCFLHFPSGHAAIPLRHAGLEPK